MRRVVPLLLMIAAALPAAEPVAATPWDVRKEAQELLDDLANKRGDVGALLERSQALIGEHGTDLIAAGNGQAPIAVVIPQRLHELGLDQEFIKTFEGPAARRLKELPERADDQALLAIAIGYPGTAASAQAWSRLADRAWDEGRIGRFVQYARRAGDGALAADSPRRKRLDAALGLLGVDSLPDLPASLDGLSEVWRLGVEERRGAGPRIRRPDEQLRPPSLAVGATEGDAAAASDGMRLIVFDQLIGRQQGPTHVLGYKPLDPRECRPVAIRGGFAALGIANDNSNGEHVVLTAVDRLGERLWQAASIQPGPQSSPILGVSAPVALDGLVVFAVTMLEDDNADLRVQAFDARTGKPAWDAVVARLPGARRAMWQGEQPLGPAVCVHEGSLLVLSNCGVVARVAADGEVLRVWSYPSTTDDVAPGMAQLGKVERQGAIATDGTIAVATPSDNAGLTLIIPRDGDPEPYRGDGAGGDVLAVASGAALFVSRSVTCLDLASRKPRWSKPLKPPLTSPQACIGRDRVLLCGKETWTLLDLKDGAVVAQRYPLEQNCTLAVSDQMLLFGGNDFIAAYGGSASTIDKLVAAANEAPQDYRPRARLAALLQMRGDADQALARYVEALQRGAPADYAERAARIVRERLDLAAGDAKAFPAAIAHLEQLAAFDPALGQETAYWRARDAEARGDKAAAAAGYLAATRAPVRLIRVRDRVEADLRTLARGGLYRLGADKQGLAGEVADAPLPTAGSTWQKASHRARTTLIAKGLALGYADGFLVASKLSDGSEAWWRKPNRALLGVQGGPEAHEDGVPIKVMPGTSAEAAGMKSGDVLVEFNGHEIKNFSKDLVPAVINAAPRSPYKAVVMRGEERLTLEGVLGGDMVEPVAANARTVLVWPTLPDKRPQGQWFEILDLETGAEAVTPRRSMPTTTQDADVAPPLLTSDDIIVCVDGQDLIAIAAHASGDSAAGRELWRLPGQQDQLGRARLVGSRLLWLPDPDHGRGQLVELASGAVAAAIPCETEAAPVIDGFDCFARVGDLGACCWDLGAGRERWRTQQQISAILAARGDAVYVITQENQLAVLDRFSGKPRRVFGEWSNVASLGMVGDRLYLSARTKDTDEVAALNLAAGSVAWEQALPVRCEAQAFIPSRKGLGVLVRDGDSTSLLALGADGAVIGVEPAGPEHQFFPLEDGYLDAGPEGLRVVHPALPAAAPAVTAVPAADGANLQAAAQATAPSLKWQAVGSCAYAVARAGGSLLVFMRGDRDFTLRFGDAGRPVDLVGQELAFSKGDESSIHFEAGSGAWHVVDQVKLMIDGAAVQAVRIDPPPDRSNALPIAVRADADADSDVPNAPWWLSAAWRGLAAPGEATAPKDGKKKPKK